MIIILFQNNNTAWFGYAEHGKKCASLLKCFPPSPLLLARTCNLHWGETVSLGFQRMGGLCECMKIFRPEGFRWNFKRLAKRIGDNSGRGIRGELTGEICFAVVVIYPTLGNVFL